MQYSVKIDVYKLYDADKQTVLLEGPIGLDLILYTERCLPTLIDKKYQ